MSNVKLINVISLAYKVGCKQLNQINFLFYLTLSICMCNKMTDHYIINKITKFNINFPMMAIQSNNKGNMFEVVLEGS